MFDIKEFIEEWFENKNISILNIYVLSLILIEQIYEGKDKSKMVSDYMNLIINILSEKYKIDSKTVLEEIREEKETLEEIGKLLLEMTKNPKLLQKPIGFKIEL
jgi:hypothetical protein